MGDRHPVEGSNEGVELWVCLAYARAVAPWYAVLGSPGRDRGRSADRGDRCFGWRHRPRAQTPEGGTVKAQHGDWQVVCKPPPPGAKNEVCALVQSVTAEDRNNIGLTVYFQKFSDGKRVLRVFAPLGVLLPPGLGLKIDDKDVGHAPFVRCHNFACYAQVVAEPPLIEQLKTGKTAVFIIFQTEEAGIGIPDLARRIRPGARCAAVNRCHRHPTTARRASQGR